jgi:hypothetical protein
MNKTKIFDEKMQILIESMLVENAFVGNVTIKRCSSSNNIANDIKSNNKICIKRYNTINDFRSDKIKDVILSKLNNNSNIIDTTSRAKHDSPTTMKRLAAKGKNLIDKFWTKIDKASSSVGGSIINDEEKSSSLINDNDDTTDGKSKSMVSIFKRLSATKDTLKKVVKEQLDKRRTSLKSVEI